MPITFDPVRGYSRSNEVIIQWRNLDGELVKPAEVLEAVADYLMNHPDASQDGITDGLELIRSCLPTQPDPAIDRVDDDDNLDLIV